MKATLAVFLAVAVVAVFAGCELGGVDHKIGEKWTLKGECTQATCQKDGSVSAIGCAQIRVSKGWTLTDVDLTKKYPACCPKPVKTA